MSEYRPNRSTSVRDRALLPTRRQLIAGGAGATGALLLGGRALAAPAAHTRVSGSTRHVRLHRFSGQDWVRGSGRGVRLGHGGLVIARPVSTRSYADPIPADSTAYTYDVATWTSPVLRSGFALTELISSWNVDTPAGTWVEINARGTAEDGTDTDWFVMGRWCAKDPEMGGAIRRTSVDDQATDYATVWTDTLHLLNDHTLTQFQLRIQLMRRSGTRATPTVRYLGAVTSSIPDEYTGPVSKFTLGRERVLKVPTYSQEVHVGHYPQWNGGGEAWCSPTSSSMLLASWGRGPSKKDLSWVDPPVDGQVDYAARGTYDATYDGCGNWPFNTAYTASFGLSSFVTRLRSLAEAERFIAAGIPLATSQSFKAADLDGAGYSTNGHLMALVGFSADGDPVMNDPASHLIADDDQVRVTYRRDQFEAAWLGSSGGVVYVNHPAAVRLPRAPREANW